MFVNWSLSIFSVRSLRVTRSLVMFSYKWNYYINYLSKQFFSEKQGYFFQQKHLGLPGTFSTDQNLLLSDFIMLVKFKQLKLCSFWLFFGICRLFWKILLISFRIAFPMFVSSFPLDRALKYVIFLCLTPLLYLNLVGLLVK